MLEDHLGDILRKARNAANLSLDAATSAIGIPSTALNALESTGELPPGIDLPKLAATLGLDPRKLAIIAGGWTPNPMDLTQWRELHPITTSQDGNAVHCYLVWDEVTREAALFDTGWNAGPVLELIAQHDLQLRHLFLTHLHEDHVAGMAVLRERFPKLHLHTNSPTAPPQHRNRANDCLHLGSLRITNRETPGHASEGVTYLIGNWPEDAPHVAIVGDTLFAGSMASGFESWPVLKEKIRTQILSLPPDTLVCPGHGPLTTVALERANNPFFA